MNRGFAFVTILTVLSLAGGVQAQENKCDPRPIEKGPRTIHIPSYRFEVLNPDGSKVLAKMPVRMQGTVWKATWSKNVPHETEFKVTFDSSTGVYTSEAKSFKLETRNTKIGEMTDNLSHVGISFNRGERKDGIDVRLRVATELVYSDTCIQPAETNPTAIQKISLEAMNVIEGRVSDLESRDGDSFFGRITKSDGTALTFFANFYTLSRSDKSEAKKKIKSDKTLRLYFDSPIKLDQPAQVREVREVDYAQ